MKALLLRQGVRCDAGSAAAEMAMVTPLLVIILFGSVELGNYFWNEHIAIKAVRDGSRYAARQPVENYPCGGTINTDAEARIKNVTVTGRVTTGGNPRLAGWDNAEVTVTYDCQATPAAPYNTGLYSGLAGGARRVTVSAAVPYRALIGAVVFPTTTLEVRAEAQAAVFGI
jgi:Flp pilus assembly protein TadG